MDGGKFFTHDTICLQLLWETKYTSWVQIERYKYQLAKIYQKFRNFAYILQIVLLV